MYLARTPALAKRLLGGLIWGMQGQGGDLYLTFDDGPDPLVTPWVLDELARFGAKATFFCTGRNAEANPELMDRLRDEGHAVGNHTWDHPDGWRTPTAAYLRNVLRCQRSTGTRLFRPPYGRITPRQVRALQSRFEIVMWDVLSADFDTAIGGEHCLRNVLRHARPGSIIVFHDSPKAWPRLRHALPLALEHLVTKGFTMRALPEHGPLRAARE